jgi:hypothetical protein
LQGSDGIVTICNTIGCDLFKTKRPGSASDDIEIFFSIKLNKKGETGKIRVRP